MVINLKLGDRLAIIKDGVKKGLTPQLAIQQYQVNKDGGYNNWKNQFKLTTGVNPDLDDTYNYELFFKENPEAAKLLLLGKISPEILQIYKTPQAIQKEKQVLLQRQKGNINSLMDYSLYEKLINDYMNKSVSTPMYAVGGPISINMYANGTSELATSDNPNVTEIGMIPEKWSRSIAPDFIEVTPEELQYFKRATMNVPDAVYSDESVPLEYKDVASKHTKWVSVPWDYIEEKSPNSRRSKGSTHAAYYMLEDVDEDNPKKYYRLYRVRESSPEGRAYDYWKRQQAYEDRQSREYEYNYGDGEWLNIGTSEVLPQVTVTYNPETKNYVEEPQEEIITSENTSKPIADSIPISETSPYAQGNSETSYYNPFNDPDGELNVPNNNPYGTEGVSGGSSFGSGTEGIKMPDVFDMNIQDIPYEDLLFEPYQWQLEDLEYLNPPGYVPIPNWEVSQIYDPGAEGVDFADFMMKLAGYDSRNNTRDLLMQQLMLPKDYFADPYAGNNYNDARSFYDAYNNDPFTKIQRESNGIPLYVKGGKINKFEPGGFVYIPNNQQNMVVNPFEFEGIRYGWLPNGGTGKDVYKEHNDRNGVYVRWDNDNNKWAQTTVPRDLGNIKNYFANRHNKLSTYDDNAPAANAYNPYNNPAISAQLNNLFNNDPVIKELRRRFNDMAVANRTLGRNNWWEGVGIAMTPFNLVMPSNIYGSIAKLIQEGGNFADYLLGGNNLGFAQTTQGTRDWAEQHPYLNMGVNLLGDAATGYGMVKGLKVGSLKYNYLNLTKELKNNKKIETPQRSKISFKFPDGEIETFNLNKPQNERDFYDAVRNLGRQQIGTEAVINGDYGKMKLIEVPIRIRNKAADLIFQRVAEYNPEFIENTKSIIKNHDRAVLIDKPLMESYMPNTSGFTWNTDPFSSIALSGPKSSTETFLHELRHKLLSKLKLTDEQKTILENAYEGIEPAEREPTNTELRANLLPDEISKESINVQNEYIENIPDAKLIQALHNINGYGQEYVGNILQNARWNIKNIDPWIPEGIKKALKYVPVTTGVTYGIGTTQQ